MALAQIIISIKIFALVVALFFTGFSFWKTRQRSLKTDTFITAFFGFYAGFITMNLINVYMIDWRLGGVGVSMLFMMLANLMFCLYALEVYHRGNYWKSKRIQRWLFSYIFIGSLNSIEIGVVVYLFHDYETSGLDVQMGTLIGITVGIVILYLTVFALFLGKILQHWKILDQLSDDELSSAEKRIYRIKSRYFALALILLILMSILLYFDMAYSERTLLSLGGWICLIAAMGSIFGGYWMEFPRTS